MDITELFQDKTVKGKEKTAILANWLTTESLPIEELIAFAEQQKDPVKATSIEAIVAATLEKASLANENTFLFVTDMLLAKAPRIKWESAKVIGNIAYLFPQQLDTAITNLLSNTAHEGTVVRWSMAFALGEIVKLNLPYNMNLITKIKDICSKEEKNSIKKIYLDALRKVSSLD